MFVLVPSLASAQTSGPTSGEITVQLTQGLDSATNPRGLSQGVVTKSSNPAIPVRTAVIAGLASDPVNGGYTAKLVALNINGRTYPAASSSVALAPDVLSKLPPFLRGQAHNENAVSGAHVFLPEKTFVQFTLMEPPAKPTAPVRAAVQPPPPPKHPSADVVDLPPAVPGAPALHASRAASEGCWWEPFAGKTLGFELPVQRCDDPTNDSTYQETATGLSYQQGKQGAAVGFTVLSKPAAQSVAIAIKTQFLKKPNDRVLCTVSKSTQGLGSFEVYSVAAGSHTRTDCAGLYQSDSDATESTSFFFNPAESKTKFIKFTGEFIGVFPFDLQALRFVQTSDPNVAPSSSAAGSSAQTGSPPANGSASSSDGPPGPVAPVNRLNVRGISVRMGRGQILAAARAAGMVVVSNTAQQLKLVDPTVNAPSGTRAYGLIMTINLVNDTAVMVNFGEQGGAQGATFQDISKKWGKPTSQPPGWDSELGARGGKATWGDKKTVYADYNPSMYSMGGQTVTIYDAVALAPHPQVRQGVPM
jgi:hypothetical protein